MLQLVRAVLTATAAVLLYNKVSSGPPARPAPQPVTARQPHTLVQPPVPAHSREGKPAAQYGNSVFSTALLCLLAALCLAVARQAWDVVLLVVLTSLLLASERVSKRSSAAPAAAIDTPQQAHALAQVDLTGVWLKNSDLSDSMDEALDLIQLGGIIRTAVRLVRGVEIKQSETEFELAVFSIISWFRVVERYALDGTPSEWKRRDLRRGKHTGRMRVDPGGRALVLDLHWGTPVGGQGTDEFYLADPDTLHVRSTLLVNERKVQYVVVYNRKQ